MEIFVKALKEREEVIESLYKNQKILVDRIKTQHERWLSDIQNYEEKLSQKEGEIETLEMTRLVEKARNDQLLVLKEKNHSLCKEKLDQTEDVLDEFKAWIDIFTSNQSKEVCTNSEDTDECRLLEAKIKKQKRDFAKLAFGKTGEVSSLETRFAWSEFKRIEGGFTEKLVRKEEEIKEANMSISSLQEQLQASNHEKGRLMSRVAELEDNASKKKVGKILRLTHDVKTLRRSARLRAMQK
ncbi:unnamed protein product [Eruca vesicaria subsp. sativa]|uniref:Uncharacterized protein n=1 Tax=Eruca vesicaria subsp. sativa TaxID=29727 RepID=A0ABC8IWH2_ERUVS|nr:unnamed protein product [Eruca vesicaria subsp. sativa]